MTHSPIYNGWSVPASASRYLPPVPSKGPATGKSPASGQPNETGLRLFFQRRFFRWRSSVLKLKPRLWQNSLRRIPLLTNSVTNCWTSARVRGLGADNSVFTLGGSHDRRSRTRPYTPSNPFRMSVTRRPNRYAWLDPVPTRHRPAPANSPVLERTRLKIRTYLDSAPARQRTRTARNSVRVALAVSWRPTPPAPTVDRPDDLRCFTVSV